MKELFISLALWVIMLCFSKLQNKEEKKRTWNGSSVRQVVVESEVTVRNKTMSLCRAAILNSCTVDCLICYGPGVNLYPSGGILSTWVLS